MLPRELEPEVMDSEAEAAAYDAMDHADVNARFASSFLAAEPDLSSVLDLGTGTAQIPLELCRQAPAARIVAVDLAESMLALARQNIASAGRSGQIEVVRTDAKRLPFPESSFSAVMSNSIVHHIPEPRSVLAEAVRVVRPGGLLFFRDLLRPADRETLEGLVQRYAGAANAHQKQMFRESLHAALTLDDLRTLILELGFAPESAQATSDRHWTWQVRKPLGA